jgi:iron complex transport system ATP-binding protein
MNGSGKSTLLSTLAGLLPPLAGTIQIAGGSLVDMRPEDRSRLLSLVLTGRPSTGLLDVRTLIGLGRQPWTGHFGRITAMDRARIEEAMELTGTTDHALRTVTELSDGEAQRVMIARALAQDTPIILLDEPMAYLDLVNRVRILRLLKDLARSRQKAILLSTHDLQSALDMCDRLFLVHDGRLWSGTVQDARSSGVLQEVFAGEGLSFDPVTGSFRPA